MNLDRAYLGFYLGAVFTATLIHNPVWLACGLVLALLASGRKAMGILRQALFAVLTFNLLISLSYILMAWLQDVSPWVTLIRLNLRVLLITCLTFLFIARVNLFRALDFSPGLTFALGLAYSQALTFRRAHDDFRLALASRSLKPPRLIDRYRASAAAAAWFIEKALHAATQSSQALRSRGFFND